MSSLFFLGVCQKAVWDGEWDFRNPPGPFQPHRLRFSTCAVEVSACIPADKALCTCKRQASGRGFSHLPWNSPPSLVLQIPQAVCVLHSTQEAGRAPLVTWNYLVQPWLWATRMRWWPLCLLRLLCVSREGSSGWARNTGIIVACKELHSLPCQATQRMWSSTAMTAAVGFY